MAIKVTQTFSCFCGERQIDFGQTGVVVKIPKGGRIIHTSHRCSGELDIDFPNGVEEGKSWNSNQYPEYFFEDIQICDVHDLKALFTNVFVKSDELPKECLFNNWHEAWFTPVGTVREYCAWFIKIGKSAGNLYWLKELVFKDQ